MVGSLSESATMNPYALTYTPASSGASPFPVLHPSIAATVARAEFLILPASSSLLLSAILLDN
jgi:hypothetical protein